MKKILEQPEQALWKARGARIRGEHLGVGGSEWSGSRAGPVLAQNQLSAILWAGLSSSFWVSAWFCEP